MREGRQATVAGFSCSRPPSRVYDNGGETAPAAGVKGVGRGRCASSAGEPATTQIIARARRSYWDHHSKNGHWLVSDLRRWPYLFGAGTSGNSTGFRTVCVAWLCAEASMKTKLSGKLSHYDKMAASAQQFFREATACREKAARSLDQVDREGWLKLAHEWTELALAAERGQIFRLCVPRPRSCRPLLSTTILLSAANMLITTRDFLTTTRDFLARAASPRTAPPRCQTSPELM